MLSAISDIKTVREIMYTETEGIILRQTKTVRGRRMVLLFSKKFGKISVGTNINEKGRSKSALAMRPFTLGRYEIYKKGDFFSINGAETVQSFYSIGEDVDKYMYASYALELLEKVTVEGQVMVGLFQLTADFLVEIEKRKKKLEILILAYETKVLQALGYLPQLRECASCGSKDTPKAFSVKAGGILCGNCCAQDEFNPMDTLIYPIDFGIVSVIIYFLSHPLKKLENLALDEEKAKKIREILKGYRTYYLDIETLKSEDCIMRE